MTDETFITVEQLVKTAEAGKHRQKELICSWSAYVAAKSLKSGLIKILIGLRQAENNSFDYYLKTLRQAKPETDFLTSSVTFNNTYLFYKEELNIINYMLKEYRTYLSYGHFLESFLYNKQRDIADQVDYLELLTEYANRRDE